MHCGGIGLFRQKKKRIESRKGSQVVGEFVLRFAVRQKKLVVLKVYHEDLNVNFKGKGAHIHSTYSQKVKGGMFG